jgi:hypothetical protein
LRSFFVQKNSLIFAVVFKRIGGGRAGGTGEGGKLPPPLALPKYSRVVPLWPQQGGTRGTCETKWTATPENESDSPWSRGRDLNPHCRTMNPEPGQFGNHPAPLKKRILIYHILNYLSRGCVYNLLQLNRIFDII